MKRWRGLLGCFVIGMMLLTACVSQKMVKLPEGMKMAEAANVTAPVITSETKVGKTLPVIFYEDTDKLAFYSDLGIFIYSKKNEKLEQSFHIVDDKLKLGGEGEYSAQAFAEPDLSQIYIVPDAVKEMKDHVYYIYDTKKIKLYSVAFEEIFKQENVEGGIIGGADGPTAIFLTAKKGGDGINTEHQRQRFTSESGYYKDLKFIDPNSEKEYYPFKNQKIK